MLTVAAGSSRLCVRKCQSQVSYSLQYIGFIRVLLKLEFISNITTLAVMADCHRLYTLALTMGLIISLLHNLL